MPKTIIKTEEQNHLITTHSLDFLSCDWPRDPNIQMFKIGSCEGLWYCHEETYVILSVINDEPGNGHFDDVFEWFEFSAKRDGYRLMVQHIMNSRFYHHLTSKRGFVPHGKECVIKQF